MARSTPTISNTTLLSTEEDQAITRVVASVQWFEWLRKETSTISSFHSLDGSYTARKERAGNRRGGWYWKAYRKHQGTQYRAYIGKSEDLTLARLNEIVLTLSSRIQGQASIPQVISEVERQPNDPSHPHTAVPPFLDTNLHPPIHT